MQRVGAIVSKFFSQRPLVVLQQRGVRFNVHNHTPYDTRIEITNETNRDPWKWDIADLQNPDVPEEDILYKTIDIDTRAHDDAVLSSYEKFLLETTKQLGITVSKVFKPLIINGINVDKIVWRRTLLKAAFVKRKYRVQYETRTYLRNIQVSHLTGSTADTFLEYIQRNLPEGVAMQVKKCQAIAIPPFLHKPIL